MKRIAIATLLALAGCMPSRPIHVTVLKTEAAVKTTNVDLTNNDVIVCDSTRCHVVEKQ